MPPLPPIAPPSRTIANLGALKADIDKPPDDNHYLSAKEWNWAVDYILWLYDAYNQLALTGSVGTIWDAYQNHSLGTNLNPARVYMDSNVGSVIFTDHATPIAQLLLGVSASDGTGEYGFWSQGLRLRDSADAIHTSGNVAIRMRSSRAAASGPAYRFDSVNPYTVLQSIAEITNAGAACFTFLGGAALLGHDPLGGGVLWSLVPTYSGGKLRLASAAAGGGCLLPQAPGVGTLGDQFDHWLGMHARYHATARQPRLYAASMAIDINAGEFWETVLSGNLTISGINNAQIGSTLTMSFWQDATGGHQLTLPADVFTNGPFRLSPDASRNDTLTVRFSGFEWIEIGRRQHNPPERGIRERSGFTGGIVQLSAAKDAHLQTIQGVLTGPAEIEMMTAGAVAGDRFEIIFTEATGVTTTAVNVLTVKVQGGPTLLTFNQNKTLKGRLFLYHNGTTWAASAGAALSYV